MAAWVRQWWFAAVPAAAAVVLALWGVGAAGPWWDELYTLSAVIHGPGSRMWEAPLLPYYVLVWLWTGAGVLPSIEWIRMLSGLSIVAGAVAVALAGRRLAAPRVGFAAAMFFVLAPGVARYGQEARVYALAASLVAIATWALVEALRNSTQARRWWIVYGIAMGAAVLFLPTSWAAVTAHAVVVLGDQRRTALRPWLTSILFLTPLLALEVILSSIVPWWHSWLGPPSIGDLPFGPFMVAHSEYTSAAVPIMLVALCLFSRAGRVWLLGIAIAVLCIFAASLVLGSWWTARSFLPLSALVCIGAALALARAGWWTTGLVIALVFATAIPDLVGMRTPGARGPDVRELVDVISREGADGDQIVVSDVVQLGYAWDLYLADDPRGFTYVAEPSGTQYWELTDRPSCTSFREWEITGGATLRLCG